MISELRVWLLWWAWAVGLNTAALVAYFASVPQVPPNGVADPLVIDVTPAEIKADDQSREVTITAKLPKSTPLAADRTLTFDLEGPGAEKGPVTVVIRADAADDPRAGTARISVPRLPAGGPDGNLKVTLRTDPKAAGRGPTVLGGSWVVAVRAPAKEPDPEVVPVWLEVTPTDLKSTETDDARTVTLTVRTDKPVPAGAPLTVNVMMNAGDLSENKGFTYADPNQKGFVIPPDKTEAVVKVKLDTLTNPGEQKKFKAAIQSDTAKPQRYRLHGTLATTGTVTASGPPVEYKIELTAKFEPGDEPYYAVTATARGKAVGQLKFTPKPQDGATAGADYVIDGAPNNTLPLSNNVGTLNVLVRRNPDLPPARKLVLQFNLPDADFVFAKGDELTLDLKPDYTGRDVLLLVMATETLFDDKGEATAEGQKFAKKLSDDVIGKKEYGKRLIGGGAYLIPCPLEKDAEAATLQTGWRGRAWASVPLTIPKGEKAGTPWSRERHLFEFTQAALLARQTVAKAVGDHKFTTIIVWPTAADPDSHGSGGKWFSAKAGAEAMAEADGNTHLLWVSDNPPDADDLKQKLADTLAFTPKVEVSGKTASKVWPVRSVDKCVELFPKK